MVIEFKASYMNHWDGHVNGCRHFDNSACTCDLTKMVEELIRLRKEMKEQEEQIASLKIWFPDQAKVEIARLRSITKWQRERLETLVVKPVLED